MRNILAVDDEAWMCATVADYLAEHGFSVRPAKRGDGLTRVLAESTVDLLLIDVGLGNLDLKLVQDLRTKFSLPIIVVSGHRDEVDRILYLEVGADDCVTKPLAMRELLARIRAVLRRINAAPPTHAKSRTRYRFAGWELGLRTRQLIAPTGHEVPLTRASSTC